MRNVVSASLFGLAVALALPASAQSADDPVLMEEAPFQVPIFENDYIILLSINIPPGRDTGFHTHYADTASVNLSSALRTNQAYGSPDVSAPTTGNPVPGGASFTSITENGPRTHKASNVGPTAFRTISLMFKDSEMVGPEVSDRSGVVGYTQLMDNERVRAWRVTLEPGQAAGEITQTAPGIRIYVRGGVLDEIVP